MTDQEKLDKKARDDLERFSKSVRMKYTFRKILTFEDLLVACGYTHDVIKQKYFPSELERRLSLHDVNEYLDDRRIELTTAQWLKRNPPIITYEQETQNQTSTGTSTTDGQRDEVVDKALTIPTKTIKVVKEEVKEEEVPFIKSPNESKDIFFFWFQKKAIMQMLKGILGE